MTGSGQKRNCLTFPSISALARQADVSCAVARGRYVPRGDLPRRGLNRHVEREFSPSEKTHIGDGGRWRGISNRRRSLFRSCRNP
jgi:hypothetical protein